MTEAEGKETEKPKKKPSAVGWGVGCGVMLLMAIGIAVGLGTCSGGESDTTDRTLNAQVRYDDGQFTITNNDNFAWSDVEFDLNYETFSSGYTYRAGRLEANTVYTVGSMQFAESDGTMFNPFTQRPLKLSIRARTPSGDIAYWYGGW